MEKHYYGSHIGISKNGILNAVDEILHYKGNIMQIFITNPQARKTTKRSDEELSAIRHYAKQKNVKIVIHAPYLLNMAHPFDKDGWIIKSLLEHLSVSEKMGAIGVIIHMGKYLHLDKSEAIANTYHNIRYALDNSPKDSTLIMETSSGQGTELGYKLEELKIIYDKFTSEDKKRLKICVDTCHVFASGYDLTTEKKVKEFIKLFDKLIWWNHVVLIHLNDSKFGLGSRLDRHEILGEGDIGLKGLEVMIKFASKANIPLVLETPGGYPQEIKLINKLSKS